MQSLEMKEKIIELMTSIKGVKAFYLRAIDSEDAFQILENERFHAASVIKLFYLYTVLKLVETGALNLETKYAIEEEEQVDGAGIIKLLTPGTELSLRELLYLMIDISDNTATNMVFDIVGKEQLNDYIQRLGAKDTLSPRKLMKVIPGLYSYTSAKDVALCLERLYCVGDLSEASVVLAKDILIKQQYNDSLSKNLMTCNVCGSLFDNLAYCPTCEKVINDLEEIPVPFYHKTGEIEGVVHDAGVLVIDGVSYIMIMLTKELDSNTGGRALLSDVGECVYRTLKK